MHAELNVASFLAQPPILEDAAEDILMKAQRGLQLSDHRLCALASLSTDDLRQAHHGQARPEVLERLANVLHLHAPSLIAIAQGAWRPAPVSPIDGFAMFTTWYGEGAGRMTVNAYLIWDEGTKTAASFDTGSTCQPMLETLREHGLTLTQAYITHTHGDHRADLARLLDETGAHAYGSRAENPLGLDPLAHGDTRSLGSLRIQVLGTSGHTAGGLSFYIQGLSRPLVVVGDALFAGSQGGAADAYAEALRNNREKLLSLPGETIICPGHGPLTTVAEERAHNPFFPELK